MCPSLCLRSYTITPRSQIDYSRLRHNHGKVLSDESVYHDGTG